jgi:hypothetical protein
MRVIHIFQYIRAILWTCSYETLSSSWFVTDNPIAYLPVIVIVKQLLINRLKEYTRVYNCECHSVKPKSGTFNVRQRLRVLCNVQQPTK